MNRIWKSVALVAALACTIAASGRSNAAKTSSFYLKPGDRVVFYGDSITDQRLYTNYIESYCVSRFPNAHYTFIHSGWGGDRVTGGGGGPIDTRLTRDVMAYKPNVVTICLGMNDGSYRAFDKNIFDTYVKGYRHILDRLIKELPGVRITLLTASAYDDVTRAPGFVGGYNATLVAYGEAVRSLGKEYGLVVADTNSPLVGALARAHTIDATLSQKIIGDRVHPGPGGHLLMAAAVLKAWNAPSTVSSVSISVSGGKIASVTGINTKIVGAADKDGVITFTESDYALPWPLDRDPERNMDMLLVLSVTDVESELNNYTLKVTGLETRPYTLTVDGVSCGTFSSKDLATGIDLAAITNLPENVQAQSMLAATKKHNDIHFQRWRAVQVKQNSDGLHPTPEVQKQMDDLDVSEEAAVTDQRTKAAPKSHKVSLAPA